MTGYTRTNPGLEVHGCAKTDAHGPHEWDFLLDPGAPHAGVRVWCRGVRAHANTMIGQSRG